MRVDFFYSKSSTINLINLRSTILVPTEFKSTALNKERLRLVNLMFK